MSFPAGKVWHRLRMLALSLLMLCAGGIAMSATSYVGIGYNLLKGNPDGGPAVHGGVDPGLLITRKILALEGNKTVQFESRISCSDTQTINTFYGTKSYQNELAVGVEFAGDVNTALASAKFSLSSRYEEINKETSINNQIFQDTRKICNMGRVRFVDELAGVNKVRITDGFAADVCRLPAAYKQKAYMDFLDDWGTHMTMQVDIGTKIIYRSETSRSEFVKFASKNAENSVSAGGSYLGYGASLQVNFNAFKSSDSYSKEFGSQKETITTGTKTMPEPISVILTGIEHALQDNFWNTTDLVQRKICQSKLNLATLKASFRQALDGYVAYKRAPESKDPVLVIPLTWPRGTYGLPKAISGCPGGNVEWHEGARNHDSENLLGGPYHLAGNWIKDHKIRVEFCIKGEEVLSEYDTDWPDGSYCIYKYGTCPTDFMEGNVRWDDADFWNTNSLSGIHPDGIYDKNTQINFCCRNDDVPLSKIYLPTSQPFYLLRQAKSCQLVHGMTVQEEVAQYDEAAVFAFGNKLNGLHPYVEDYANQKIFYCYYTKA